MDGARSTVCCEPGDRQTLVAERDIAIRFGDAGAITWTINGRDAGVPGANGAVRDVRVTRENAAACVGKFPRRYSIAISNNV